MCFIGDAAVYRLERAQVDDHRLRVFIAHVAEVLVRHHREERVAVAVDAFADRAEDLAVRPLAEAELGVGGDVLRRDDPGETELLVEDESAFSLGARLHREPVLGGVVGVTSEAVRHVLDDVLAAGEAGGSRFDLLGRRGVGCRFAHRLARNEADEKSDNDQSQAADDLEERLHGGLSPLERFCGEEHRMFFCRTKACQPCFHRRMATFRLTLPGDFSPRFALRYMTRDPESQTERGDRDRSRRRSSSMGSPAVVQVGRPR